MNTSSKLIAITVIGALILAGLPTLQSEETEEYYEVTRYNMRGLTYDKETIQVSYDDAMAIKDAFEGIDSSFDDDKIERKTDVLISNNLITTDVKSLLNPRNTRINSNDVSESYLLFFSYIEGTIGPSFINLINFFGASPILLSIAKGINADITDFTGTSPLISEKWLSIFIIGAMGIILLIPFISPAGYIMARVMFGIIEEI